MCISELLTGVVIVRAFDKQQQIMYGLNLCVEPVLCMWDDDSGTSHTKPYCYVCKDGEACTARRPGAQGRKRARREGSYASMSRDT